MSCATARKEIAKLKEALMVNHCYDRLILRFGLTGQGSDRQNQHLHIYYHLLKNTVTETEQHATTSP